jgi:hypothetical protein
MPTTDAETINADLLAFLQEPHHATSDARAEERRDADRSLAGRA